MSAVPKFHSPKPRACYDVLGLPFDAVNAEEVRELFEAMIASTQPHYLLTADHHVALAANDDEQLQDAFYQSDLLLGERLPISSTPKVFRGGKADEMLCGTSLLPLLLKTAEERRHRVFFLGTSDESTQGLINEVLRQYPALDVAGSFLAEMFPAHAAENPELISRLEAAHPDVILVSLRILQQEKWLAANYRALGAPISMVIDTSDEASKRSHQLQWRQNRSMNWFARTVFAPHLLLKRYMEHTWALGSALLGNRHGEKASVPSSEEVPAGIQDDEAEQSLQLPARVDATLVADCGAMWNAFAVAGRAVVIEASRVQYLDATGVGALLRLAQAARVHGGRIVLVAPSPVIRRAIILMKAGALFTCVKNTEAVASLVEECVRTHQAALREERRAKEAHLIWTGQVSATNQEDVWAHWSQLLRARALAYEEVAIDLSQVKFLDQAGLDLMARLRRLAAEQNTQLRFINASPSAQRTLRLAKLESVVLEYAA